MRLRVLIADDHPLFRMGLAYALRGRGFEIAADVSDGREAVERCRQGGVDVALLDVKMPVMDGIEACRAILGLPDPPLVAMLTTFEEPAIVKAAADAGAVAYLSKETDPGELADRLRSIVARPDVRWLPEVRVPELSPRELQVLEGLSRGLANKRIARELELSPETVKDYLNNVYRKLEVRDRLAAVQRARELGLLG